MLSDQNTIDREFGNLLLIDDNYPKYVVTMDEISSGTNFKGIRCVHLREFLSSTLNLKELNVNNITLHIDAYSL